MDLGWLESILYSLISGITEFLPVSSRAHQVLLLQLFGTDTGAALLDLTVHLGMLLAVCFCCANQILAMRRTKRLLQIPKRRRKRQPDPQVVSRLRLLKTAAWPVLILTLLFKLSDTISRMAPVLALCLILNGILLYLPSRLPSANKDAGFMTRFDGLLIGITSGLGIFPGISRVGAGLSVARMRGAEPQEGLGWTLLLSIPALAALCVTDVVLIAGAGLAGITFVAVLKCLVGVVFAYAGAYLAIGLLRFMAVKLGFTCFSYYAWGLSLLTFILYMI